MRNNIWTWHKAAGQSSASCGKISFGQHSPAQWETARSGDASNQTQKGTSFCRSEQASHTAPVSTSSSCPLQQKVLHGRFSSPGGASVRTETRAWSLAACIRPSLLQGDKSQVSNILIWESKVWNSALDPPQASWACKYFKSNILSPNIFVCKACLREILKSSFRPPHVLYDTDTVTKGYRQASGSATAQQLYLGTWRTAVHPHKPVLSTSNDTSC